MYEQDEEYLAYHEPAPSPTDQLKLRLDRLEAHAEKQNRRFKRLIALMYRVTWGARGATEAAMKELAKDE